MPLSEYRVDPGAIDCQHIIQHVSSSHLRNTVLPCCECTPEGDIYSIILLYRSFTLERMPIRVAITRFTATGLPEMVQQDRTIWWPRGQNELFNFDRDYINLYGVLTEIRDRLVEAEQAAIPQTPTPVESEYIRTEGNGIYRRYYSTPHTVSGTFHAVPANPFELQAMYDALNQQARQNAYAEIPVTSQISNATEYRIMNNFRAVDVVNEYSGDVAVAVGPEPTDEGVV